MAILATERVPTLDYWKPAHKLQVGDYVFDKDGKVVRITLIQEYRARACYEVTLDDHLTISGDEHLGFQLETRKYRLRLGTYKGKYKFRRPLKHMAVSELVELPLVDKRSRKNYSIPTVKALQYPHQDLPVPPFVFGFWFYNRRSTKKFWTTAENTDLTLEKFNDYGYLVTKHKLSSNGRQVFTCKPIVESHLQGNLPNKIPNNYLFASEEQRIELLSGIMCAKVGQYRPKDDEFQFSSKNFGEVTRIQGLVESLGSRTRVFFNPSNKYYTLYFKTRINLVANQVSPPVKVHRGRRYIKEITQIAPQSCVHIETSGIDNTILVGEGYIATC